LPTKDGVMQSCRGAGSVGERSLAWMRMDLQTGCTGVAVESVLFWEVSCERAVLSCVSGLQIPASAKKTSEKPRKR